MKKGITIKPKGIPSEEAFGTPKLTPDDVLETLESKHGVTTTIKSLQRYAKIGLITAPETKGAGRGKGKTSLYLPTAPAEFFASHQLITGSGKLRAKAADVAEARIKALKALQSAGDSDGWAAFELFKGPQPPEQAQVLSLYWLKNYTEALKQ